MNKIIIGIIALVVLGGGALLLTQSQPSTDTINPETASSGNTVTGTGENVAETSGANFTIDSEFPPLAVYSEEASAQAATEGKSVLMFHATWCPVCRAALKDFNENLDQIPEDVTMFRVDFDTQKELKAKHAIVMQDTFVQVDAEGNELTKWNSGGQGIKTLLENII